MPDTTTKRASSATSAAQEEEIYGALGALLGTLEVIATDDDVPLAPLQAERLRAALRLCHGMQHQLEGLLTLAADDLDVRLRRSRAPLRPLIEHAVRGALRSFEQAGVELTLPTSADWGSQVVDIDPSRVDRMLRGLTETMVSALGRGGAIDVSLEAQDRGVAITLAGRAGQRPSKPGLAGAVLVSRGAARLFALHGGSFTLSAEQLTMRIVLPLATAAAVPSRRET